MKITAVRVNGMDLTVFDTNYSISFYNSFIEFCIDNCLNRRQFSEEFQRIIKLSPDDPTFGRAIHYGRIIEYHGFFYSDWLNNETKIRIMNKMAREIGFELEITTIP